MDLPEDIARVVGGESVNTFDENPWPWITHLELVGETRTTQCGASLITDTLLLSAAHCFTDTQGDVLEFKRIIAKVGVTNIKIPPSDDRPYFIREVICSKVHPEYSAMNFLNDIVILKLNASVGNVPTPILTGPNVDRDGDFYLAGWGGTRAECNALRS